MSVIIGGKPAAESGVEAARWAEVERRRQILGGQWRELLRRAAERKLGRKRMRGVGEFEVAQNALEYLCRELAVLYEYPPAVNNGQPGDLATFRTELRLMNVWGILGEVQYFTLGLRNMLVRVDVEGDGDEARASVRPVFPDLVHVDVAPNQPAQPVAVREWRQRTVDGKVGWYLDDISTADPDLPFYRVLRAGPAGELTDVTEAVLGQSLTGDEYPYRDGQGRPLLPYVAYHARHPASGFWRSHELKEVVEGTLTLAIMDGFAVHVFFDASWPQRWAANATVVGAEVGADDQAGDREEVITDPSSLLFFSGSDGGDDERPPTPVQVGQFAAGGDPEQLHRTLEARKAALITSFGVPPGDLMRTSSQGAASGVALALSNEGKRAAQRRSANVHRDSDERLIRLIACMLNRFRGVEAYAEWGYSISYTELPLSPQERQARQAEIDFEMKHGLMGKVGAYMLLHPGVTEEDAQRALDAIAAETGGQRPATGETNGR
jgi:hypothetical protein